VVSAPTDLPPDPSVDKPASIQPTQKLTLLFALQGKLLIRRPQAGQNLFRKFQSVKLRATATIGASLLERLTPILTVRKSKPFALTRSMISSAGLTYFGL